ncbi:MAG: hypothetical protein AB7F43_10475 [Bacteriovoracia bacterium]
MLTKTITKLVITFVLLVSVSASAGVQFARFVTFEVRLQQKDANELYDLLNIPASEAYYPVVDLTASQKKLYHHSNTDTIQLLCSKNKYGEKSIPEYECRLNAIFLGRQDDNFEQHTSTKEQQSFVVFNFNDSRFAYAVYQALPSKHQEVDSSSLNYKVKEDSQLIKKALTFTSVDKKSQKVASTEVVCNMIKDPQSLTCQILFSY